MRRGSLGPTLSIRRQGIHGRRRSRSLAIRQVREQARSRRELQARMVGEEHAGLLPLVNPVTPSGKVIR